MWISLPTLGNIGILRVLFFGNAVKKPNKVCGQIVDNSKRKIFGSFSGAFFDEICKKKQNWITFRATSVDKLATGL